MNRTVIPVDTLTISRRVQGPSMHALDFAFNLDRHPAIPEDDRVQLQIGGKLAIDIVAKNEYIRLKEASQLAAVYSVRSMCRNLENARPSSDTGDRFGVKLGNPVLIDDEELGITVFGIGVDGELIDELEQSKSGYTAVMEEMAEVDPMFDRDAFEWDEIDGIVQIASFETGSVSEETQDLLVKFTQSLMPQTVDFYDVKIRPTVVDMSPDSTIFTRL